MTSQVIAGGTRLGYRRRMTAGLRAPIGSLLREWRQRRRLSQLELALAAEVSARHLSFLETGRAMPSREMVLRLAERLEVPLRERNRWLTAAGFAPMFAERPLDDPALRNARAAVEQVLRAHEPCPALALDRHWNLVSYNRAVPPLLDGLAADLLVPPVNVLRLSLHPHGLAPRILNLAAWRHHLFARLRQQIAASGDAALAALHDELSAYPVAPGTAAAPAEPAVLVPLQLASPGGTLSLISTTMVFGTPVDITLAELAIETFFPADAASAALLRRLVDSAPAGAVA
uniref:helix-turn-helix domain-containing protein n=2 Tax=Piscinibacter defluvii TaxID=1796922 RepID=UPI0035C1876F